MLSPVKQCGGSVLFAVAGVRKLSSIGRNMNKRVSKFFENGKYGIIKDITERSYKAGCWI